jgi:hypothetical protein
MWVRDGSLPVSLGRPTRLELRGEVSAIDAVPGLWRTGEDLLAPAMSHAEGGVASRR